MLLGVDIVLFLNRFAAAVNQTALVTFRDIYDQGQW